MFEYKIEKLFSTHSFDKYQISVITMSGKQGDLYKGIAVSPIPLYLFSEATYSQATGDPGKPLIIDIQQSLLICQFIEEVLSGSLPRKIEVKTNGPTLRINLTKYTKDWHGGGGYKGKVGFSRFRILYMLSNVTIARKSLVELRNSFVDLYKLENRAEINA